MVIGVCSNLLKNGSLSRYSASCQIGTIGSPVVWIVTSGRSRRAEVWSLASFAGSALNWKRATPAGVAGVVERHAAGLLGRSPGVRIDVSWVVGAQVLPPHRPPRDRAREEVIEDRPEVGDVCDLFAVVTDRAASGQPAAEHVGI